MRVVLGSTTDLGTAVQAIRQWDASEPRFVSIEVAADCRIVHPLIAVAVASVVDEAHSHEAAVTTFVEGSDAAVAMSRIGLAKHLRTDVIGDEEPAGTLVPMTRVRSEEHVDDVMTDVMPLLHAPKTQAEILRYVLSELVRNVLEHARSPTGAYIAATYDRDNDRVAIGVADAGCGVFDSMQRHHAVSNDAEAIAHALRPGISGTTARVGGTENNAGLGLFYTKAIASLSYGDFAVGSGGAIFHLCATGNGQAEIHTNPDDDPYASLITAPLFPGTIVGFEFRPTRDQPFSALLSIIGEIASSDVRHQKKQQQRAMYRKPQFRDD